MPGDALEDRHLVVAKKTRDSSLAKSSTSKPLRRRPCTFCRILVYVLSSFSNSVMSILWKRRGHAEDTLPEHFCNKATDPCPDTGDGGAGRAWLLVVTTIGQNDFPESLPDGIPEITRNAFAPGVLHPPDEARGSDRRDLGGINIGLSRTAYLHVVTDPRLRGVVSPLDVSVIRVVRFQPPKGGLEFRDVNFE